MTDRLAGVHRQCGFFSAEKRLDVSVLHGDGTNTVAKKGRWLAALVPFADQSGSAFKQLLIKNIS
jgi:hypothetical protein